VNVSTASSASGLVQVLFVLIILLCHAFIFLKIAARLVKNGILNSGHRLNLPTIWLWLKKS
jgi:ABC-2 type transport system permease protein